MQPGFKTTLWGPIGVHGLLGGLIQNAVDLGLGLRFCASNKLSGDANMVGIWLHPQTTTSLPGTSWEHDSCPG